MLQTPRRHAGGTPERALGHMLRIGRRMRRLLFTAFLAVLSIATVFGAGRIDTPDGEDDVTCDTASRPMPLIDAPEASGIARGTGTRSPLWTIDGSGQPLLFAVDTSGRTVARLSVTGARVNAWEDLSVGPCAERGDRCLYIADVGDSLAHRPSIRIYRVPEPSPRDRYTRPVQPFDARYPDDAHDAAGAFVLPDGRFFLVTRDRMAALYEVPLETGRLAVMRKVAMLPVGHVTGADASADGARVAIRTKGQVVFYRTRDLLDGDGNRGVVVGLDHPNDVRGEGVTFGSADTVVLVGYDAGRRRGGIVTTLRCRFTRSRSRR